MDTRPAMEALKERAFAAREPLYMLCDEAGVSPAAFTRSNAGKQVWVATLRKLEQAMDRIEARNG